ncbi:hypothetical protein D9C73_010058 [Collichthys lucidus]|uniref:Uncharacterized protein n=1 Tax=Collichthys lucidus TaxID=240159 RepID=A0A4U5UN28_COLLU|nr:hypothetical protein D9C73_010058 [Collichthys lucidus]
MWCPPWEIRERVVLSAPERLALALLKGTPSVHETPVAPGPSCCVFDHSCDLQETCTRLGERKSNARQAPRINSGGVERGRFSPPCRLYQNACPSTVRLSSSHVQHCLVFVPVLDLDTTTSPTPGLRFSLNLQLHTTFVTKSVFKLFCTALCSNFIFTSARDPVSESAGSGRADGGGQLDWVSLLSLLAMEPQTIHLCQRQASQEPPHPLPPASTPPSPHFGGAVSEAHFGNHLGNSVALTSPSPL